jgi:hypothetical protein
MTPTPERTPQELEEQAKTSGYGATEGETDEAPDQVLPEEITRERDDREQDDPDRDGHE